MEIAIPITLIGAAVGAWKIQVIGRAQLYRRLETWARIHAAGWEAYDAAVAAQRRKEVK